MKTGTCKTYNLLCGHIMHYHYVDGGRQCVNLTGNTCATSDFNMASLLLGDDL